MKQRFTFHLLALALCSAGIGSQVQAEGAVTANVSVTNNYLWRGLTQTANEGAVQGGIDYADASGFYAGTWVSNVQYGADDVYSYEHDLYLGYAGEVSGITYDIGYLYYNYDSAAQFDFAEVYGTIGMGNFSASLYLLAHTEADEGAGQDFGFGKASYVALDYVYPLESGTEIGFHLGHHQGDFAEAFNGVEGGYNDWNVSISKDGFGFMVSGTTGIDGTEAAAGDPLDNDKIKFAVSYSVDFTL